MTERSISIHIPEDTRNTIETSGKELKPWLREAILLGVFVSKGFVYQAVGDEFVKLSMRDFTPFPKPRVRSSKMTLLNFELEPEVLEEIKGEFKDADEWCRSAVTLRLRAGRMELFFFEDDEYSRIDLTKDGLG
jgi:hypothetical protein